MIVWMVDMMILVCDGSIIIITSASSYVVGFSYTGVAIMSSGAPSNPRQGK